MCFYCVLSKLWVACFVSICCAVSKLYLVCYL